ncbi:AAA family ATPase [Belliella kenyensis]|uniref:AAA family ATPase n=1 Tax=Belliella kenyensis TaxID=1472724 RepID=A0ABV8EJV8_9BACT|nr:AAA family ATPase [Belliella kenyensis]MCH7400415.1 AAA family ATPase [Belliella kenyensis]MDN3604568.1 AAA family ATPase [Belliella kenyensis]
MLQNIKIEGFKSIKTLDLKLSPINLLIGSNGVGKSNFISFFKLVNNIYEQRLQQYSLKSGVDNLLHYGRKNTAEIKGYLDFGNNAYEFLLFPSDDGTLFIGTEDSILPGNTIYQKSYSSDFIKESTIKNSATIRNKYLREHLVSYKIYHFHDTSSSAPLRSFADISNNRILKEEGENLPAFLYYLQEKHPKHFKMIEMVVKSVFPFFDRFDLAPFFLDENKIELEWYEKEHPEHPFYARHFSDGTLRFIALTTLFLQPNLPKTIIIDEPELGLHPFAISKLAGMIKKASVHSQIIIATQSVNLVNEFSADDIIVANRENNQTVFKRQSEESLKNWLEEYSIGELWEKNVIGGRL